MPIRAAAEPLPDDPDNNREDDIQVTRVPNAPKVGSLLRRDDQERSMTLSFQYRDPLVEVLDYIAEVRLHEYSFVASLLSGLQKKCPEGTIAIAHDDDLPFIENVISPSQIRPEIRH